MFRSLLHTTNRIVKHGQRNMHIYPVPNQSDNYAYVIVSEDKKALVVDPFDVIKVLSTVKSSGVAEDDVVGILTTHWHQDHAGGNIEFVERLPHAKVWGGSSRVKALTEQALVDNQTIADIIPGISLKCIHTPCHTQDSFCFYLTSPSCPEGALFTGDTLFIGGCGRFFEGTPGEMNVAFDKILGDDKNVPGNTKVFVGHEYTAGNIAFAESILGKEDAELGRLNELLKNNSGSVIGKTTIADERRWNIFWKDVWQRADKYKSGKHDDVLGEIRSLKDNFRA